MLSKSLTKENVSRLIRKSDVIKWEKNWEEISALVAEEVDRINNGASFSMPDEMLIKDKKVYYYSSVACEIILRKIYYDIARLYKVKPSNRSSIASHVSTLLEQGGVYSVMRIDIKSFFESVNVDWVLKKLMNDGLLHYSLVKVIRDVYNDGDGGLVLKRGISVSSVLSEIAMRRFDKSVSSVDGVFFYGRFVDDIIVFTCKDVTDLIKFVKKQLPKGMVLNEKKTSVTYVPCKRYLESHPNYSHTCRKDPCFEKNKSFEYLGYKYRFPCLCKIDSVRQVSVDIALSKEKKIMTRVFLAFLDYSRNKKFALLHLRIKFLTGNFTIDGKRKGERYKVGVYYNYPMLSDNGESLGRLDEYLKRCILFGKNAFWGKVGRLCRRERNTLLRYSFSKGFNSRVMYSFNVAELADIVRCWKHA